ncbi:hypothetical protein Caci_0492 [Catenulispora acidiphila DSM 44928]|uniref:TIR domain-containing protein n=1 Tax=Catenulispora acidiphila (strain DSM 44928 / JCM 14897 / NBRC 102108 / NRRL B-24433 / ID139908) TaxID=479433 RepID=C7PX91_CATAD|nr:TIR-like protein FxsC [Catenulispora acidiphila]ACU69442.1 hypothetical protein Caci_0492 [Catenulispora acidiphila DSM 44928]
MPHFFFSYSRKDAPDEYLYRFYDDLCREISVRSHFTIESAGFIDKNQPVGGEWEDSIGVALGTCDVFVPVYSPSLFGSSNCGQEWHAFGTRQSRAGKLAPHIVPVWWVPTPGELPTIADRIQDTRSQFGAEYQKYGLRYLMQLKENESLYRDFLVKFTMMVLAAGENPPELMRDLSLAGAPNAFALKPETTGGRARPRSGLKAGGIKSVRFVVAAGSRDEMRTIRAAVDAYGAGSLDWQPYHPEHPDPIVLHAQGVAIAHRMVSSFKAAMDDDLFELLERCQASREPVVLIVDPWVVELDAYKDLLARLDTARFGTTAVVVPWESGATIESNLRDILTVHLGNWMYAGERFFRDDIRSMGEFEANLGEVLVDMWSRIVKWSDAVRRVDESGPASRPILTGPGS